MRTGVLIAVLAGLGGLVVHDYVIDEQATRPSSTATVADRIARQGESTPVGADQRGVSLALPDRAPIAQSRTGLFSSHSWQPSISRSAPRRSARVALAAPPMPYRFVGALVQDGKLQVLLATGDTVVPAREGETIEGGYRVDSIGEDQITLTYLPLKKKEVIPLFSSLLPAAKRGALASAESDQVPAQQVSSGAASNPGDGARHPDSVRGTAVVKADVDRGNNAPARLLWHGPNRVQLGKKFTVSLRVTSAQPVRASPMRIKVNPALLETVAVKPGQFFGKSDRDFGYRVNPDGSIFVAATSQNPTPATDAEFVVLTFIPRRAAPEAELNIASLSLEDPAGRPIAFGQPQAFRTAIGP